MAFMKGEQGSTLIEAAELSDAGGGGGVRLIGVAKGIPPPPPPGSMQPWDAYYHALTTMKIWEV